MVSSIRNFFIALFISAAVFGIGAYFIVKYVEDMGSFVDVDPTEGTADNNGSNLQTTTESDGSDDKIDEAEFTALILGIDAGASQTDEKLEADTIILLNLNAKTHTLMISPLPCDMKTEVGGYILRLGAVYGEYDSEKMMETVRAYTGLKVDYLCVFDYESIKKVFDVLGDVEFNIPMKMDYKPKYYYGEPTTESKTKKEAATENNSEETTRNYENEEIHLKAGKQKIDGETAIQLLRFKDYTNGNYDRIITQMNFLEEVIRQKMTAENLPNAEKIYTEIKESIVETNMDEKNYEIYKNIIFSLSEYTRIMVDYPGLPNRVENGTSFFVPSINTAINRYIEYRKQS